MVLLAGARAETPPAGNPPASEEIPRPRSRGWMPSPSPSPGSTVAIGSDLDTHTMRSIALAGKGRA